eukprot:TRINITY_DN109168_c0_g1_i1.p1 TRINITY_DN109168_c0_g1~~TRINITY_DN109168_c0_g1_i1.p1  ORF type:complete len:244 (+),score=52.81 TRINITY_DN109168_c0_g1_i1:225-956(+)
MGIPEQLAEVQAKVQAAAIARAESLKTPEPAKVRLVAVSKTKPVEDLKQAYDAGHRHFGENYVQEVVEKAPLLPADVQWHFIGHLQSNKVTSLVKACPNLACLETIDSEKLARAVDKAWQAAYPERPLRVMIQVNSSGEETKNGVEAKDVAGLARIIAQDCSGLQLAGLMTIGAPDYSGCRTEDFETLRRCRDESAAAIGVDADALEMSMGMSSDYETAIREGSTSVRVGSSIFGARHYPAKS